MIRYAIPGMYELANMNIKFLDLFFTKPNYFYDDIEIAAIYGNPQFCIWDGGRIFSKYSFSDLDNIKKIVSFYNKKFCLPIRYVFTNSILEKKHYKDRFCNKLMEIGENFYNEVVIADDNLMNYLKETYPNYSFISSTTKCLLNEKDILNELEKKDYKMICLDYNHNKNFKFLNTLSLAQKEKIEFLINPICPNGCKIRKEHYYLNSFFHLNGGKKYQLESCGIKDSNFNFNIHKNHISYNLIKEKYKPKNFTNFKIEGRTWNEKDLLLTYCDYMVKPKYKNLVLTTLL